MPARRHRADRADQYKNPGFRNLQERLARAVQRQREKRGWTQADAADAIGMSLRLLQRIEAGDGNTTFTTLARICDGFGVDVVQLLSKRNRNPMRRSPGRPAKKPGRHE